MSGKSILVADDDDVFLRLAERDLTRAGYSVIEAHDGEEALRIAKSLRPNLILLDINMPKIDGGEVASQLRSYPLTKDIPIIYLTSMLTKEEEREIGGNIKGNFIVAKPYDPEALLAYISRRI